MDSGKLTAGALLRQARWSAGLSQVELAARAGVTQSVISAYESGHRQPSVPALAALVEAADFELVTSVRRQPRRLSRLSGPVGQRVRRRRRDVVAAAAAHGVSGLRVFGSVARGEDRPGSDVDLFADLPPGISLFGLGRVQAELEAILGTRVDLVPAGHLKPDVLSRAGRDLVALWATETGSGWPISRPPSMRSARTCSAAPSSRAGVRRGRIRLLEIGEAVKALPADLLATQPAIPWSQIARMRDHLAHRYFDTAHAILQATVDDDLPELERAVRSLTESLDNEKDDE